MSADLLRRAAALIRDRAEAASPSPWKQACAWRKGVEFGDGPETKLAPVHWGKARAANTEHIASWHPDIALAVARWLDYEADEIGPLVGPDGRQITYVHGNPYAVTIARAYLGEEVGTDHDAYPA